MHSKLYLCIARNGYCFWHRPRTGSSASHSCARSNMSLLSMHSIRPRPRLRSQTQRSQGTVEKEMALHMVWHLCKDGGFPKKYVEPAAAVRASKPGRRPPALQGIAFDSTLCHPLPAQGCPAPVPLPHTPCTHAANLCSCRMLTPKNSASHTSLTVLGLLCMMGTEATWSLRNRTCKPHRLSPSAASVLHLCAVCPDCTMPPQS